jgi:cyclin B
MRKFGTDITNTSQLKTLEIPNDPQALPYYSSDIFRYLHEVEGKTSVKPGYLKFQNDINEKMRAILIDWLTEVHLKFKLVAETLYLTVDILDRYLEKVLVTKARLQLVGVTALLIASKFEDVYAPEVNDLVYITDKAYDRESIINMEASILKTLDFNISCPSILLFLERYCAVLNIERNYACFARYLVELTLAEYKMLKFRKSLVAASAVLLMHKIMQVQPEWPEEIQKNCPYLQDDLKNCSKELCMLFQRAPMNQLATVRKKFMMPVFYSVANTHIKK